MASTGGRRLGGVRKGAKTNSIKQGRYSYQYPFEDRSGWWTRRRDSRTKKSTRIKLEKFEDRDGEGVNIVREVENKSDAEAARRQLVEREATGVVAKKVSIAVACAEYARVCIEPEDWCARYKQELRDLFVPRPPAEKPEAAEPSDDADTAKPGAEKPKAEKAKRKPFNYVAALEELGCRHITDVKPDVIQELLLVQMAGRKGRTRIGHAIQLANFFDWCIERSYIASNPVRTTVIRKKAKVWRKQVAAVKTTRRALKLEEAAALLCACREAHTITVERKDYKAGVWSTPLMPPEYLYGIVLLLLRTGVRFGNVVRMRWGWLDLEKGTIDIPAAAMKMRVRFLAPLHPEVVAYLKRRQREWAEKNKRAPTAADFVFQFAGAGRVSIKRAFRSALRRAELVFNPPVRVHDLRHTFAHHCKSEHPEDGRRCVDLALLPLLMAHKPAENMTAEYAMRGFRSDKPEDTVRMLRPEIERVPWLDPPAVADNAATTAGGAA